MLVAEAGKARAELARWTGDPDPQPSGPLPHFAVSREALRAALARHPELELASASVGQALADVDAARAEKRPDWRSEEHTSELQSLMRISYAVFCLKNKIRTKKPTKDTVLSH